MPASKTISVNGKNNVKDLDGLDTETATRLGKMGICSGITTAWMLALLNDIEAARGQPDDNAFVNYFNTVLRFQGAYLKDMGGKADDFFFEMNRLGFDTQIGNIKTVRKAKIDEGDLPSEQRWAAYVSVWGHAIGMAIFDGRYLIMDANKGLLEYDDIPTMLDSLSRGADAHRRAKGKTATDTLTLQFFAA